MNGVIRQKRYNMWLFSELEGETGIDESILYQKAIDDDIEICSV